jgi:hypothetical protein
VVGLIAGFEPTQDRDGVFDARFADIDRLEASFEGGVFFDVLAVLIERRSADTTQLPASQFGLEELCRIA